MAYSSCLVIWLLHDSLAMAERMILLWFNLPPLFNQNGTKFKYLIIFSCLMACFLSSLLLSLLIRGNFAPCFHSSYALKNAFLTLSQPHGARKRVPKFGLLSSAIFRQQSFHTDTTLLLPLCRKSLTLPTRSYYLDATTIMRYRASWVHLKNVYVGKNTEEEVPSLRVKVSGPLR